MGFSRVSGWVGGLLSLILVGRPACSAAPTRIHDVIYGRKYGMALTMDVLKPTRPNGIGVIFMVSGGWVSDIGMIDQGFLSLHGFNAFTDRSDTVFLVCHGSQPKFTIDEIVPDIYRAVRFIRTHAAEYGVNPDRLGISGMSSGGHLSLMIGTTGGAGRRDGRRLRGPRIQQSGGRCMLFSAHRSDGLWRSRQRLYGV